MKSFRKRFTEAFNDEVVEGTIYRIDLDRVDVIPLGSTGIMQSLPLTGDRDKVQVGDRVRVMRVGGERVALVGDVALGFDYDEEVTEPTEGITPLDLEEALTDREAPIGSYVQKNDAGQVGINRAPDPQFDLDVAGSIRTGGYFVGPHALQLAGAKLIAHFDGPEPFDINPKGDPNGHMGQIGTLVGTSDFRAGKFNKALHLSAGATLSYGSATAIDITQPGTLSFWRRKEVGDTDTASAVWLSVGTAAPDYLALKNSADLLRLEFIINTTQVVMDLPTDNEFHHYALTWDGATASMYIDGVLQPAYLDEGVTLQIVTYTPPTVNPATLSIFAEIHTLDDLAILDHAIGASEVRAVFESGAPVFAETSTWGFRSPNTFSYVDSEGLWAVSSAGNPAFGVSGVDGKSWGGQTLDAGDVMIGRGANCIRWDDSEGTAIFAVDGAGITNINGSNITTGTITAEKLSATALDAKTITGSTVRSSATNPRIEFNSSGLTGYDSAGDAQAYFGSDGAFYAGDGNVVLNKDGLTLIGNSGLASEQRFISFVDVVNPTYEIAQIYGVSALQARNALTIDLRPTYRGTYVPDPGAPTSLILNSYAPGIGAGTLASLRLRAEAVLANSQKAEAFITMSAQDLGISNLDNSSIFYWARTHSFAGNVVMDSDLTLTNDDLFIGDGSILMGDNLDFRITATPNWGSSNTIRAINTSNFYIDPKYNGQIYLNYEKGLGITNFGAGSSSPNTVVASINAAGKLTANGGVAATGTISTTTNLTVGTTLGVTGNADINAILIGSTSASAANHLIRTSSANLVISPKDAGNLYLNHDQGVGNTYISGGASNILVTVSAAGKLSTSQGISGAVYYPLPATTVFSENGVGKAVLGDHKFNMAPTWIPANAIAFTGRLGGIFPVSNASNWMALLKYGEAGTGIYCTVVRADSTVVHNSDAFVCNCTTDGLGSITVHINGQTASSIYLVVTGYFAEL